MPDPVTCTDAPLAIDPIGNGLHGVKFVRSSREFVRWRLLALDQAEVPTLGHAVFNSLSLQAEEKQRRTQQARDKIIHENCVLVTEPGFLHVSYSAKDWQLSGLHTEKWYLGSSDYVFGNSQTILSINVNMSLSINQKRSKSYWNDYNIPADLST